MDHFMQERDNLIDVVLNEGRSYANQYEEHYRKLIQEFIITLETEMSKHLDALQESIEADRESIFQGSKRNIQFVTDKADNARNELHRRLQQAAAKKRKEILEMIDIISKDKTRQPLGYEQFRKLDVKVYSTVGIKKDGDGCENISDRQKFITDIDKVKPPQPRIKRTVYIEKDVA